ncbi:MAG TPA: pentapeptide repeat-containing protein, partial [Nitrospiraceae bacterium]|nr:pentapeptide repeat-containing protein [Nitrospiraceae bacterium]
MVQHLGKACTVEQREARSIPMDDVLQALKKGHDVDLSGVILNGDLHLDALPTRALDKVLPTLHPDDRRAVEGLGVGAIRYVSGRLSIRDSEVRGRIVNPTRTERLVISGPVILSGTRFQEAVDLSRTVFLGVMDCSSASFAKESYFVQARFQQPALFTQTVFGPHTRFHRSVFRGAANFYHAQFSGLAELLEVSFEQGANFSGARFGSGTGLSGSRFSGTADFFEARFDGDVYFLFTRFEREARFRDA